MILGGLLLIYIAILTLKEISKFCTCRSLSKSGAFDITNDTISSAGNRPHLLFRHKYSPYLYFSVFRAFELPTNKRFYEWSDVYEMSANGVKLYSSAGDTFYIVTTDGKTPLMVYNTKLFEYKE